MAKPSQSQTQSAPPSSPPQTQSTPPFPLNEIIVITLYAVAMLTVFLYSSNLILSLVYMAAIGGAAVLLQPQFAIYTVAGIILLSVLLHSMNTTVIESTAD